MATKASSNQSYAAVPIDHLISITTTLFSTTTREHSTSLDISTQLSNWSKRKTRVYLQTTGQDHTHTHTHTHTCRLRLQALNRYTIVLGSNDGQIIFHSQVSTVNRFKSFDQISNPIFPQISIFCWNIVRYNVLHRLLPHCTVISVCGIMC